MPRNKTCIVCGKSHTNSMSKCCSPLCERKHRANLKKTNDEKVKVKKEKVKTKKAFSRSKLVKEADRVFSLYIRERDLGQACITCEQDYLEKISKDAEYHLHNKFPEWNENHQNGHFQSRRHLNARWHEKNAHGQCPKCNNWGAGEQFLHGLAIDRLYGQGTAQQIMRLAQSTDKTTDEEILGYIRIYYRLLSDMAVDFKPKRIYLGTN